MSEHIETDARPPQSGQFSDSIERVWMEIKQISKQVELETRKSGRVARLHLELRKLRREQVAVRSRLGKAVYEAHLTHGDEIALHEVEGFAGGVAALDTLSEQIASKEAEVERLRHGGPAPQPPPQETAEEVA